jgi:PhzF family phenazine biosynthesis protein
MNNKTPTIQTYIVDSFTDEPFKGNPAGVCLLNHGISDDLMLKIAKELNLSETAFVEKSDGTNVYSIRFFSPKMEIPLCGHATLASAKVLFDNNLDMNQINFINIQNLDLKIVRDDEMIVMEFPVYETVPKDASKELLNALGINESILLNSEYNDETKILLLEIYNNEILNDLKPDFEALYKSHDSINGVLVTALSNKNDFDFESRYFWPWSGSNEDPVTGATHTFLAKYWSKKLNKTKMNSFQCSERTGFMEIELISETKLTIRSTARIIFEGKLKTISELNYLIN